MRKRILPYVFLSLLFVILIFTVGVRLGRRIEQVDKNIKLLINLPPSPTPGPTQQPVGFSLFSHTGCFVDMLVPYALEKDQDGSSSAVFSEVRQGKKQLALSLSCTQKNEVAPPIPLPSPLFIQSWKVYPVSLGNMISFTLKHPNRVLYITISTTKDLFPLIQKGLSFE